MSSASRYYLPLFVRDQTTLSHLIITEGPLCSLKIVLMTWSCPQLALLSTLTITESLDGHVSMVTAVHTPAAASSA